MTERHRLKFLKSDSGCGEVRPFGCSRLHKTAILVPEESAPFCRRRRSSVPDQVRQLKSRRPPIHDPSPTVTMFSRQALLRSARAAAPSRAIASQARFYAAPAATETVKAPVALFGLDGTYATALVRHRAESTPRRRRSGH